ncbi:hypothetical protein E4U31_003612 [Claviceps sp. LM219 group G6]|nr:hypothetical protein E4U31_003612 [Claviceps sp. LM219 group G6]
MTDSARKSHILAISLAHQFYFDDMFEPLITAIKSKAKFTQVKDANSALQQLSQQPSPTAVLITDEALTLGQYKHVWSAVLQYIRSGGKAVIMGTFTGHVKPPNMKPFFAQADLPWECGSYHRTTVVLNSAVIEKGLAAKLPAQYSQKAVAVKNVAPNDAWYMANDDSVIESMVFAPTSAKAFGESPVTFASVGDGKLGYIGDVNAEQGSNAVTLAMCGLL